MTLPKAGETWIANVPQEVPVVEILREVVVYRGQSCGCRIGVTLEEFLSAFRPKEPPVSEPTNQTYAVAHLPTTVLEAELTRRKNAEAEAKRVAEEVDRKQREVEVECPVCEGSGRYPHVDYPTPCLDCCGGTGHCTALLWKGAKNG